MLQNGFVKQINSESKMGHEQLQKLESDLIISKLCGDPPSYISVMLMFSMNPISFFGFPDYEGTETYCFASRRKRLWRRRTESENGIGERNRSCRLLWYRQINHFIFNFYGNIFLEHMPEYSIIFGGSAQ